MNDDLSALLSDSRFRMELLVVSGVEFSRVIWFKVLRSANAVVALEPDKGWNMADCSR